ncbi:MAG: M1 family aminopeptidase [Candidatus Korarchaeota archaeon]|nr:HEAT repeat domain-containing protein [Thermoproteota archaeon]MCR8473435.1 HEAT repeat domain-containing protein [Thermoproteota archaeon]MCR8489076.1 HEAT repeat domain-containing protein [Thermoproteota archaeon]
MYITKHGRDFAFPDYKPEYPLSPPYEIKHLSLALKVFIEDKKIEGHAEISVVKKRGGVIELDAVDMEILDVRVNGSSTKYTYNGKKLAINTEAIEPGTSFKIDIMYSAYPKKGLYFVKPKGKGGYLQVWSQGEPEDNRYWIPIYDYPNMKFTCDLKIYAPKMLTVFANGELKEVREEGEWKVWHWVMDQPIASYLIAIAIGEFDVKETMYKDIKLTYAVPKGRGEDIDRSFSNTPDMLKFFEEFLMYKYPWKNYKQVCVSEFIVGGMENTTLTMLTELTLHDEKAHAEFESEPLVSHELAHQWFGDLITTKDWGNIWLNESFATYLEALYMGHLKGEDRFICELISFLDSYLREYSTRYSRPIMTRVYKYPEEVFDAHSYPKGALVLHTLRTIVGDDKFREILRKFLEKHAFSSVDTEDFRKVSEEVTGEDLEWFFDQYIYNAGHPELTVRYSYDAERKVLRVSITQTQKEDCWDVYKMPIEILIKTEKETKLEKFWLSEKEQTLYIPLDEPPEYICVDPKFKVFAVITEEEELEQLIKKLKCTSIYCRIRAIRNLSKKISDRAVEALKEKLLDESEYWMARSEAAKALGSIGTEKAKRVLIEALEKVANPRVRRGIAEALGNFRDHEVAEALAKILKNKEEGYYVRAAAAESLGKTKWEEAIKILKKVKDEPSHNNVITIGAIRGLAALGSDEAFEIILEYTKEDKPTLVRMEAVRSMSKFNEKASAREIIINACKDENMRIRSAAITAIRETLDPRYIPILDSLIGRELHSGLIRAARETIRSIQRFTEKGVEYRALREEIEKIREEHRRLLDQVSRLEMKLR